MLSADYKNLPPLSEERLKKQRTALLIIAFLLLVGGILRLIIPLASGTVLSILVGVLLLLSGTTLVAGMIANWAQNAWPLIGGILLGEAYLIVGYRFITSPLAGIRGGVIVPAFSLIGAQPHNYVDVPVASAPP